VNRHICVYAFLAALSAAIMLATLACERWAEGQPKSQSPTVYDPSAPPGRQFSWGEKR
jgi:hypothetical protein